MKGDNEMDWLNDYGTELEDAWAEVDEYENEQE